MKSLRMVCILAIFAVLALVLGAATALAAEEHPYLNLSFGPSGPTSSETFSNPNGIAVEESTGDIYVAAIGTDTVYKFNAGGDPVEFSALHSNMLSGGATPAHAFSFPNVYGTPAAITIDNSTDASDPSRGDLYVMNAGHDAIDKFNANGEYIAQITTALFEGEPKGLAVAGNGDLRVVVQVPEESEGERVDLFDNAIENDVIDQIHLLAPGSGDLESGPPLEHSFAISPTGVYYVMHECGCVEKLGGGEYALWGMGRVDNGPGDVAMAVDPVSGHLYLDQQSSVSGWDTGGMDGHPRIPFTFETEATGALVSTFGSSQLSAASGQGGIAVDGATGDIYVANPADGKVYAFGSTAPAIVAGSAANVTQTAATLQGSVDPRGNATSSCVFEYEQNKRTPLTGNEEIDFTAPVTLFHHSVPCAQSPGQIGSGSGPIGVSAEVRGLEPGALYTFRLVAANANGESASEGMFAADASFGIKELSVSFLNANETPDTQAGSHPYKMMTSFSFNTRAARPIATEESPYELKPVGSAKDIIFTPPPGLVGNPNATETRCALDELKASEVSAEFPGCPTSSRVGILRVQTWGYGSGEYWLYNMVPPHGVAAQFGTNITGFPNTFIDASVQTGGQYPIQTESRDIPAIEPVYEITVTLFGVVGGENRKPFLTLPTGCTGRLRSTVTVDSYENPGHFVSKSELTRNGNGEPLVLSGCSNLTFPPQIEAAPDVKNASSVSGLTVKVNVPQKAALNPGDVAESALRDTTVALPAGVAINPAGADGLEACSEGLAGFTGFQEVNPESQPGVKWATFTATAIDSLQPGVSLCPDGSKIGTVKIKTYLLNHELEGAVYLATQNENPFGSLIAMYMLIEDPLSESTIKLAGEVHLCATAGEVTSSVSCQAPGQIITTFLNTPDLPFEELQLHFFGGERAPLSTPSRCGTYTTQALFTPWDGNAPVRSESSFAIEHGPNGGPCPGASLPFEPSVTVGTTSNQAGGLSPFTLTMSREDGNQNLSSITLHLPPGLSGTLDGMKLCDEADGNAGTCGPESLIGETTVSVGVGGEPFTVKGGKVYITEKYDGAPFGLSIVNPAKAGPYNLGQVVVRAKIDVNQITGALTVTSDPPGSPHAIPTILDGIPLEIKHVNVAISRPGFTFNPTDCNPLSIGASLQSAEGASASVSLPFQATNCARLGFEPRFSVSTPGKPSRANGVGLDVKLSYPAGSFTKDTNIAKVKVELPKQLPSRLSTLQKACTSATFESNPADCPAASRVGVATATTPLVPVPLNGPAYFVSHGGAKFPELIVVLLGYGITVDLHGETFISKAGITSSTFNAVPDLPIGTFELKLPAGPDSALAGNGNLCASKLVMPTSFTAQNGATLKQNTKITVEGCKPQLRVVRRRIRGHKAVITVDVPSAGRLTATGEGLTRATKHASGAGEVTLQLDLARSSRTLLEHHPSRQLKSRIHLRFTPARGAPIEASVAVLIG